MQATALDPSLHHACLEAAANADTDGQRARHVAAFLVLRVIDLFAEAESGEAISYQIDATAKQIVETLPDTDADIVSPVLEACLRANADDDCRPVWDAAITFAGKLEEELRLNEAIDVLDTALRLPGVHEGRTQVLWRRGRVYRLAGRLDESLESYRSAHLLAVSLNDEEIQLRSRSGTAQTLVRKGNIPEAERILHEVLTDSRRMGHRTIEAGIHHNLAMVQAARGQHEAAVLSLYRSYELHEDDWLKLRVISDLGMNLKDLGEYASARDCFEIFLLTNPNPHARLNANLELLELAARTSDRTEFDRMYRELNETSMPPDACVDFHLKAGQGFALFDQQSLARDHLDQAIRKAEEHDLNTYLFKAEAELATVARTETLPRTADEFRSEVRSVTDNIRQLRASV